jgi:hypothetical protein
MLNSMTVHGVREAVHRSSFLLTDLCKIQVSILIPFHFVKNSYTNLFLSLFKINYCINGRSELTDKL